MKTLLKILVLTAVVCLPGLASATHWEAVELIVDCDGWNAKVDVYYGGPRAQADVDITLILTDETGTDVGTTSWSDTIYRSGTAAVESYTLTGAWADPPCGVLDVRAVLDLTTPLGDTTATQTDTETATATLDCPCDEPDPEPTCNFTQGFWKKHPEAWPVDELELGGVLMSQSELLDIMFTPVRGDATIILAKHLIAAKLNVLNGSDDRIERVIDRADGLLERHEVGSKPRRRARVRALALKCILARYNEAGCSFVDTDDSSVDKALPGDVEDTSWSDLKANYR
ncbi:MAG: hypothetical protein GY838_10770 [bacterium]|nr:hypothetical protein [bacterium]